MIDQKPHPELICWDCGATNDPAASECWLCQRRDWRKHPDDRPGYSALPARTRGPLSTIGGWMALIAVIGVAAAIFRDAPGLAVLLFVSVVPALIVTEVKARSRRRRGEPMSVSERVAWVIGLAIVIPILLWIALIAAVFAYCTLINR